ncbi:MAG: hypothetical protein Q7T41_04285 [Candidatus Saccharibacteria bacterium]|nr:hypothetical protein [Candidatus Saccharibacteria bacterium]
MSERNAWIGVGLKAWPEANKEVQEQPTEVSEQVGEAIGTTAIGAVGAVAETKVVALDDQVPRSWDLHKSGY